MEEFTDLELNALHDAVWEELYRNESDPGRMSSEDLEALSNVYEKANSEALKRKLWWAVRR